MIPVALVAAASLVAGNPSVPQAFPTFMLIRGGDLAEPILLYHKDARSVMIHLGGDTTRPKRSVAVLYDSPIFWFYTDQSRRDQIVPAEYADAAWSYEIAEFWGMGGGDHRPMTPLRWEDASQHTMLHVRREGRPIYVRSSGAIMPVATGGILGDSAIVFLERWGVPMHPEGN